jgi:hypothetical protein
MLSVINIEATRAAAVTLHTKMTEMGDSLFLPTGGAFLSMSQGRIKEIISRSSPITDDEVFDTYAKWHEGVHMAQLVTSPFVFPLAFEMAGLAQRAYRISIGVDSQPNILDNLAERYSSLSCALEDREGDYSPIDVIETHAVTQGFRWAMPNNKGSDLRFVANYFYAERSPHYVRLLNHVCDRLGDDVGTILLPRLCFLSLQAEKPVRHLVSLLDKLTTEASPLDIVAYKPFRLCEWAEAPVSLVTRSLRERAESFLRDSTGRPARITDHPWVNLFTQYFDEFEAISDDGRRLDLLMGRQGDYSHSQFSPHFTIYPGGDIRIRGTNPDEDSEIAHEARHGLIEITLNLVSGLELLRSRLAQHPL